MTADDRTTETIELRMTRSLPATPDVVFEVYTDPAQMTIWYSILDTEPGVVEITGHAAVGETQHVVWGPSRDALFFEHNTFTVVEPGRRLAFTSAGGTPDGMEMTTEIELTFEPEGDDGCLVTVVQRGFPDAGLRDFFATHAWVGAFDRIAAYLATR